MLERPMTWPRGITSHASSPARVLIEALGVAVCSDSQPVDALSAAVAHLKRSQTQGIETDKTFGVLLVIGAFVVLKRHQL